MLKALLIIVGFVAEALAVKIDENVSANKNKCSSISEQAVSKCLQVSATVFWNSRLANFGLCEFGARKKRLQPIFVARWRNLQTTLLAIFRL